MTAMVYLCVRVPTCQNHFSSILLEPILLKVFDTPFIRDFLINEKRLTVDMVSLLNILQYGTDTILVAI